MPKLTKRVVDAVGPDPSGRKLLVWDSEIKGFGLSITPAGVKTYIVNYRTAEGRVRRFAIGKHGSPWTCEQAREKAEEVLRGLAKGIDPLEVKAEARDALTVAGLAELYLAEGPAERPNKKASSWSADKSYLTRHIVPLLGKRPVKSLRPTDISRMLADVAAGKTAAQIKTGRPRGLARVSGGKGAASHSVAVLSAALSFAERRGIIATNPAKGVQLYAPRKMERFLSDGEVMLLAEAITEMVEAVTLHPAMAAAIQLLALTACRRHEILGLKWEWIDFERRVIRFPDAKRGPKTTPLPPPAIAILKVIERQPGSAYVFPPLRADGATHMIGLQHAWDKVRERATTISRKRAVEASLDPSAAPVLTNVRLHDLRHSFASFAVGDGEALFLVGKVLGHKRAATTEIYAHLRDDPVKAVSDRTAARIAKAMGLTKEGE